MLSFCRKNFNFTNIYKLLAFINFSFAMHKFRIFSNKYYCNNNEISDNKLKYLIIFILKFLYLQLIKR